MSVAPVDKAVELLTCTVNDGIGVDDLWTALAHHGPSGGVKILEAALDARLEKEKRFDYDIWVVEIEPGQGTIEDLISVAET